LLSFQGTPHKLKAPIIGKVAIAKKSWFYRRNIVLVKDHASLSEYGYKAIITNDSPSNNSSKQAITGVSHQDLKILKENDVVLIEPDGKVSVLWEATLRNNGILLTTACDCNCLMCPQPPVPRSSYYLNVAYKVLNMVDPSYSGEICLTGGEPTLLGKRFIQFLDQCSHKIPRSSIILLTNGKRYANFNFAKEVAKLNLRNLTHGVSLHGDVDDVHDYIVQEKGSFEKTEKGLQNLAKLYQRIEIRCVVSRLNYTRLPQIAWHIYRNFPFADHVTFMALEMTGLATKNQELVWIDPFDYKDALEEAILILHRANLRVSAYNHPLCVITPWTRRFAKQSISTWKNIYLAECMECSIRELCCGFFKTSESRISNHIKPIG